MPLLFTPLLELNLLLENNSARMINSKIKGRGGQMGRERGRRRREIARTLHKPLERYGLCLKKMFK